MPKPKTTNLQRENIMLEVSKKFEALRDSEGLKELDAEEIGKTTKHLTYMQRLFVNSYCTHMSGRRAAMDCGVAEGSASVRAHQYLKMPKIQEAIIKRLNAMSVVSAINKEVILVELYQMFQETQSDRSYDRNLQIKILELISRLQGFYHTTPQVNITDNSLEGIKIQIVTNEGISNGSSDSSDEE
jgi:hypothetical protein